MVLLKYGSAMLCEESCSLNQGRIIDICIVKGFQG